MPDRKTEWNKLAISTVLPLSDAAWATADPEEGEDVVRAMNRFKHFEQDMQSDLAGTQYAALCYRADAKGKVRVLLITSRDTGRWVLPKGWPIAGKSAACSAAQEAYEEAGVKGQVDDHCLGIYTYGKVLGSKKIIPCSVAVFPMRVTDLKSSFPEKGQRQLKWFKPKAASVKVAEPELAAILASFDPAFSSISDTVADGTQECGDPLKS